MKLSEVIITTSILYSIPQLMFSQENLDSISQNFQDNKLISCSDTKKDLEYELKKIGVEFGRLDNLRIDLGEDFEMTNYHLERVYDLRLDLLIFQDEIKNPNCPSKYSINTVRDLFSRIKKLRKNIDGFNYGMSSSCFEENVCA